MAARKTKSANAKARTPVVALRLRTEVVERADAIAERLAKDPAFGALSAAGRPDRSHVLRWAIQLGLDAIEAKRPGRRMER